MHEFEFRTNSPGIVFYKEYVDEPVWKQTSLFKQGVTEDYIKTPDGLVYQSLDKFIVPVATYKPMDKVVKKDPIITRRQYLHSNVMELLLCGDLSPHHNFFFEAGGPEEGPPPVMDPIPLTAAAAARNNARAATQDQHKPMEEQPNVDPTVERLLGKLRADSNIENPNPTIGRTIAQPSVRGRGRGRGSRGRGRGRGGRISETAIYDSL